MQGDQTITSLENKYMTARRREVNVILDDIECWVWSDEEIAEFKQMWRSGKPFHEIVDWFGRDPDEITLLMIHLRRRHEIKPRQYKIPNLVKEN